MKGRQNAGPCLSIQVRAWVRGLIDPAKLFSSHHATQRSVSWPVHSYTMPVIREQSLRQLHEEPTSVANVSMQVLTSSMLTTHSELSVPSIYTNIALSTWTSIYTFSSPPVRIKYLHKMNICK